MKAILQPPSLSRARKQGQRALKLGQNLLARLSESQSNPKVRLKQSLKVLTQTLARSEEASLIMAAIAQLDATIATLANFELNKVRKAVSALNQKMGKSFSARKKEFYE